MSKETFFESAFHSFLEEHKTELFSQADTETLGLYKEHTNVFSWIAPRHFDLTHPPIAWGMLSSLSFCRFKQFYENDLFGALQALRNDRTPFKLNRDLLLIPRLR